MFIHVAYKDPPELSVARRTSAEQEMSVEKTLVVNPDCCVRVMLEYIRTKCKLGLFTQFDLCDESGGLKGLFNLATHAHVSDKFVHKRVYYIIVLKYESDKKTTAIPQLCHENRLFMELKNRVTRFIVTGVASPIPSEYPVSSPVPKPAAGKKKNVPHAH